MFNNFRTCNLCKINYRFDYVSTIDSFVTNIGRFSFDYNFHYFEDYFEDKVRIIECDTGSRYNGNIYYLFDNSFANLNYIICDKCIESLLLEDKIKLLMNIEKRSYISKQRYNLPKKKKDN